ncbi:MAG: ferritin-like domain-containing protein [Bryobacteraceae bacterium]
MANKSIIPDVVAAASNRRSFVRKLGIAGAATSAVSILGPEKAAASTSHPNDVDILNFALNLEYLEAEFYTVATTGQTIHDSPYHVGINGQGNQGSTYGGKKVTFTNSYLYSEDVANEIAWDEREHVGLLRSALGSAAIAKPTINLNALGFGFNNQTEFLKLARIFEDIGVTAYGGAAPLISNKAILGTAARILATEAEHVGNIRLQVAVLGINTAPPLDCRDILPPPSGKRFISVNNGGLTTTRTPGQVLFLAFGGMAFVKKGGFFPNGVNGYIVESTGSGC